MPAEGRGGGFRLRAAGGEGTRTLSTLLRTLLPDLVVPWFSLDIRDGACGAVGRGGGALVPSLLSLLSLRWLIACYVSLRDARRGERTSSSVSLGQGRILEFSLSGRGRNSRQGQTYISVIHDA